MPTRTFQIRFKKPNLPNFPKVSLASLWKNRHRLGKGFLVFVAASLLWLVYSLGPLRGILFDLPFLTGFTGGEKTYLLLFQNDAELRPTGGFIGNYGLLRLRFGLPTTLAFFNSYELNPDFYRDAPAPMEELLAGPGYPGLTFRDSNWDPDFPTSARLAMQLYKEDRPDNRPDLTFDGCLAINLSFVENMLDALGGLSGFTSDNIFSRMEYETKNFDLHSEEGHLNRKQSLSAFGKKSIRHLFFRPWKLPTFFRSVYNSLENKDFLVYLDHPHLHEKFERLGWIGSFDPPTDQDFLAVIETNLGGRKSNRYVERIVNKKIIIDEDDHIDVFVSLALRHHGIDGYSSNIYQGYERIFIPEQAHIFSAPEDSSVQFYNSSQVIGHYFSVNPGDVTTYFYSYSLPKRYLVSDIFSSTVLRQPGSQNNLYSIIIAAPEQTLLAKTGGDGFVRENRAFYFGELTDDLSLQVKLLPDHKSPLISFQAVNKTLDKLRIVFDEDIDPTSALDPSSYEIWDKDVRKTKITDHIVINKIEVDGGEILLFIDGMTYQDEERYGIRIRNLKDLSKNPTDPNPKTLTIVQKNSILTDF